MDISFNNIDFCASQPGKTCLNQEL